MLDTGGPTTVVGKYTNPGCPRANGTTPSQIASAISSARQLECAVVDHQHDMIQVKLVDQLYTLSASSASGLQFTHH